MARQRWRDEFHDPKTSPWPIGVPLQKNGETYVFANDPDGLMFTRAPSTAMQALMEAAPHQTPQVSSEEMDAIGYALVDALEQLEATPNGPKLRWVFDAHVHRGLSFRKIAAELNMSKSNAHWLYEQACAELRTILEESPTITEHLEGRYRNGPTDSS